MKINWDVIILTSGLVLGAIVVPLAISPVTISYDGSSCPVGKGTVVITARSGNTSLVNTIPDVNLPIAQLSSLFTTDVPGVYNVSTKVNYNDGSVVYSQPTSFVIDPLPSQQQSSDCTKDTKITVIGGPFDGIWTIGPNGEVFRNGVWGAPGSIILYKWVNSKLYEQGTDLNWYLFGSNTAISEPSCGPIPSPTPTVTPTPTSTPGFDHNIIKTWIDASALNVISTLRTPVQSTLTCQTTAISTLASGKIRLTIQCDPPNIFVVGPVKIIKP